MLGKKLWITILVLLSIFLATSYFAQKYQGLIRGYIESSSPILGAGIYLAATITATVFAPVTSLPLISIIANTWGSFIAGLLTMAGSATGGLIAFSLVRKYGQPVMRKIASKGEIDKIHRLIPEAPKHAFWTIVFLNLIIPSDILSYALGFFSKVETKTYFFGTLLGIMPSIMVLAYTGTLPLRYQIAILLGGLAIILSLLRFWIKHMEH